MTKRNLLLEIGLEEMPARFITDSINQLASKVENWLKTNNIGFEDIKLYSTPRRLALLVLNVDERQEDSEEEAKGPAKKIALAEDGEWSKAAIGFTRGQGLTVEDIYFKEINGVEYAHVKKFFKGKETFELLVELKAILSGLTFPKNMRWADLDLRYVRPIKWLVAMFGNDIIPFEIAGVQTGNVTRGHRFLGEGEIQLSNPQGYEEALLGQYVVADAQKRKNAITSQLEKIEEENGWVIPVDEDLLEEVNNLVEYPTALYGRFEEEFLEIPSEVLITSMKEHQRYFPVKSRSGALLPHFITVRNGDHLHIEKVARGNEKVLRARLADAAFFYKEDQRMQIDAALEKLKNVVYHEEIGTIVEKSERVRKLVGLVAERLEFASDVIKFADRAAQISKFDLVSQMVYEFPELQGIMGEKYALQKGESPEVAVAINEHYMPRNADDSIPGSPAGALVAIGDKLDTIVAFFSLGIIPSGSQDPYALRRQATGIVQTLIEKKWNISLENLVGLSLNLISEAGITKRTDEEVYHDLIQFFKLRIKHLLQERGIRYDLIDAVLGGEISVVSGLIEKAEALQAASSDEGFKESMEALSRVLNIASKKDVQGDIDPERFENEYEQRLYEKYLELGKKAEDGMDAASYYQLLVDIKPEINDYFEHTMVMSDKQDVRENRLNQMAALAALIMKLAKVNDIVVK
ncbi:glycine--tRNA ligase subunit beta [Mesobacillus selenatarsenatis]|uniref:Glycine--tRNA ligase beta subunit n=1 Tax=Mesobacillus selenatarsenatis (strain DSM 18680 / JCM 14380 / FERM P-15431 / SF-1) TaxID=1321606 RepID=A0A0A8X7E0_MESS1|nr:glycine--tRNA ligase subunit beta [Mesobacillus selenatarsenatis]GAM15209.1 glycyl-tRNA synthetase beta chain [Mesobacillus selenatarsenatis SF-1]